MSSFLAFAASAAACCWIVIAIVIIIIIVVVVYGVIVCLFDFYIVRIAEVLAMIIDAQSSLLNGRIAVSCAVVCLIWFQVFSSWTEKIPSIHNRFVPTSKKVVIDFRSPSSNNNYGFFFVRNFFFQFCNSISCVCVCVMWFFSLQF